MMDRHERERMVDENTTDLSGRVMTSVVVTVALFAVLIAGAFFGYQQGRSAAYTDMGDDFDAYKASVQRLEARYVRSDSVFNHLAKACGLDVE